MAKDNVSICSSGRTESDGGPEREMIDEDCVVLDPV